MSIQAIAACLLIVGVVSLAHGQRGAAPRVAKNRQQQQPANPQVQRGGAPAWFPLEPRLQQHTDKVLKFWEHHSGQIKIYRCNFKRWEDDPQFDPKVFETYAKGRIQYAKPDKGLFQVTELHQGRKINGKVQHIKQQETDLEKWICDGKTIFEFDHRNKRVVERPLPPEIQGQQIVEGPLPFLFGAKAAQINSRYWVRVNPDKPAKQSGKPGAFWIEAVPKFREDAANYKQIDIVIPDDEKFLPKAIILHHPDRSRTTFEFSERDHDWKDPLAKLRVWERAFFNPATPKGWKRFKEPVAQQAAAPRQATPRITRQPQRRSQSPTPR
jgi:TIGR03009 family protein